LLKNPKKANIKVIFCHFIGDIKIEKVSASPATSIRLKRKRRFHCANLILLDVAAIDAQALLLPPEMLMTVPWM
jgi:hypothetical protein